VTLFLVMKRRILGIVAAFIVLTAVVGGCGGARRSTLGASTDRQGPPGTGTAPTPGPRNGSTVLQGLGALTDNARHSYVAYGAAFVSGKESNVELPVPVGGTLSELHVLGTAAPGAGASWTPTVDRNGTPTTLTCSIAGPARSCTDSSRVALAFGDKLDLEVTPFGKPVLTKILWSAKITPSRR
jgi:hypothetical protein